MGYKPENLIWKKKANNIMEITTQDGKPIARIDLNHEVWRISAEEKNDKKYMDSVELLGNTKKLEGIGAYYRRGDGIMPVFKTRETTDGIKIFYKTNGKEDGARTLQETKRIVNDEIFVPHFYSYEHMRGLEITNYMGYRVTDMKAKHTTFYDASGRVIEHAPILTGSNVIGFYDDLEQLVMEREDNKLKLYPPSQSPFTQKPGTAYAVVEQYETKNVHSRLLRCVFDEGMYEVNWEHLHPKDVCVYNKQDVPMMKIKYRENGRMEEIKKFDENGKQTEYHHFDKFGRENTMLFNLIHHMAKSKNM